MDAAVTERKRKLDGRVLAYACTAVELSAQRAVLLYHLPHAIELAGLAIAAGTRSYGVYWPDRPYNVYRWVDSAGATVAYYCNAATATQISAAGVDWLDLEADVLILPSGRQQILDLDEVPATLAPALRADLDAALTALREPVAILAEVDAATAVAGAC